MRDKLADFARDSQCLAVVSAADRGSWLSPVDSTSSHLPIGGSYPINTLNGVKFCGSNIADNVTEEELLNDDFEFICKFEVTAPLEKTIFYNSTNKNMFGVYQYADGRIGIFVAIMSHADYGTYIMNYVPNVNFPAGINEVRVVVSGKVADFYYNGTKYETIGPLNHIRRTCAFSDLIPSNCGYLHQVSIRNLTKSKTVWEYPTAEEKSGLLKFENTKVFEAGAVTAPWHVKTALDLRGYAGDLTILMKVRLSDIGDDGVSTNQQTYHSLLSQGFLPSGDNKMWALAIQYNNQNNGRNFRAGVGSGSVSVIPSYQVPADMSPYNRDMIIGMRWKRETGTIGLIWDGIVVKSVSHAPGAGIALNPTLSDSDGESVYLHQKQGTWQNFNDKIYWAMIRKEWLNNEQIEAVVKSI